jgi:hypothetical protein
MPVAKDLPYKPDVDGKLATLEIISPEKPAAARPRHALERKHLSVWLKKPMGEAPPHLFSEH